MAICSSNFWEGDNFTGFLTFLVNKKGFDVFAIIDVVEKPYHFEKEFDAYMVDLPQANLFYIEHGGTPADKRFYSGLDGHADNSFGPFSEAITYATKEDALKDIDLILKEEGFECYIGQLDDYGCFDGTKVYHPGDKR